MDGGANQENITSFQDHYRRILCHRSRFAKILDVDYVCIGEGISFMRELLKLPEKFTFQNPPNIRTDFREFMGVPLFGIPKHRRSSSGWAVLMAAISAVPAIFSAAGTSDFLKADRHFLKK